MSYPQPAHSVPVVPTPAPDRSRKFLNMSGGVLAAVIAGVILLCCVGPIVSCFFFGGLGLFSEGLKDAAPKPTVTIEACDISTDPNLPMADIRYTIKNNSGLEQTYTVTFVVNNADGAKVGEGTDWVFDLKPGQSASQDAIAVLSTQGGTTCAVSEVD